MPSAWPGSNTLASARISTVPFDATGLARLTDALMDAGFDDDAIAKVMGGNVRRVLAESLPPI